MNYRWSDGTAIQVMDAIHAIHALSVDGFDWLQWHYSLWQALDVQSLALRLYELSFQWIPVRFISLRHLKDEYPDYKPN